MKKNNYANIVIVVTYIATLIGSVVTSYKLKQHYIKNKTSAGKQMFIDAGAGVVLAALFYGVLFVFYKISSMKEKSKKKAEREMSFNINEDAE